ncbi:MAG: hypothetical protein WC661_01565 [Opitutaceae bacterium]|jgi:hypothetical protein
MKRRTWVRSGVVEELDERQQRLLDHVLDRVRHYYRELHGTRPCYAHPLTLSRLMRLCGRNGLAVTLAVKILANSVEDGQRVPSIWYERVASERHPAKRYYRIFLQDNGGHDHEQTH